MEYSQEELLQKVEDLLRENNILKELNTHLNHRMVDLTRELNNEKVRHALTKRELEAARAVKH